MSTIKVEISVRLHFTIYMEINNFHFMAINEAIKDLDENPWWNEHHNTMGDTPINILKDLVKELNKEPYQVKNLFVDK